MVSAGGDGGVVGRIGKEVWSVSRLGGLVVICLPMEVRTVGRRSAGGSLRGVGSWWSGEGFTTLSVVLLSESSGGTHEYIRDSWTGGSSHTGGRRCT